MAKKALVKAQQALADLYVTHRGELPAYQWEGEVDRFAELITCALVEIAGIDATTARRMVAGLGLLGLMSPDELVRLEKPHVQSLAYMFQKSGCDTSVAMKAADLLLDISRMVGAKWDGHIQRFLRRHCEEMAAELSTHLSEMGIDQRQARRTAVLWLQNVLNAPLLVSDDEHIEAFCSRYDISKDDLEGLADDLNLYVSVLDDLLAAEATATV